ncbi:MAG TPA: hypothetical protein PLK99_06725 [Burkholderiales bacterium]|nr:hypothetical protein [Burkholderiales bacterium]
MLGMPLPASAGRMPPLNGNAWNIVFVQSLEADPATNSLSVRGFNHALRLGQLLKTVTSGKTGDIRRIYSLDPESSPRDMASTQSIEPYALLEDLGMSHRIVKEGGIDTYDSPAYIVDDILKNQPRGDYFIAMPGPMIETTIEAFGGHGALARGQYLVMSVERGGTAFAVYEDGIEPDDRYPDLHLRSASQCPEKPVSFTVRRPASSKFEFDRNQTVYFIRHAEAHPNSGFENGNFVCQGEWRAIGANEILFRRTGGKVENLFSSSPADLMGCDSNCSYVRPSLTLSPYAIQHRKKLMLAPFQWNDAPTLAASLFTRNTVYSEKAFDHAVTLVAWEHRNIESAVRYLIHTLYRDPEAAKGIPEWAFDDYDTIWKLETDGRGNITFSNSCEGLESDSLPSTCPAFPPR